jgi:hypothetical protein
MAVKLRYHDRRFRRVVRGSVADGLRRAGKLYRDECRRVVGRENPGNRPSRPGEPPRKRTGTGQANIVFEENRDVPAVRVGVTREALHMIDLELGTRRVRPRPWLLPTLIAQRAAIGRLAASGRLGGADKAGESP